METSMIKVTDAELLECAKSNQHIKKFADVLPTPKKAYDDAVALLAIKDKSLEEKINDVLDLRHTTKKLWFNKDAIDARMSAKAVGDADYTKATKYYCLVTNSYLNAVKELGPEAIDILKRLLDERSKPK